MAHSLDLSEIQGGILHGYGKDFGHAGYLFVGADSAEAARGCLRDLAATVTTAERWRGAKPRGTLNVAVTFSGLVRLGLPDKLLAQFPPAFQLSTRDEQRVANLGDVGASDPCWWEDQLGTGAAHILLTVHARSPEAFTQAYTGLRHRVERSAGALTIVHEQKAEVLLNKREHFGFSDGFSEPAIEGVDRPVRSGRVEAAENGVPLADGTWRPLRLGEFLLGHADEDGQVDLKPLPELVRNGTYMVYRKLRQAVGRFRHSLAQAALATDLPQELVAAKIVGRWRDGVALMTSPERVVDDLAGKQAREIRNDFRYAQDKAGYVCPRGAHIRRANPRDAFGFGGALSARHRIIRRGMPYGPPLAPDEMDDEQTDRGLVFICFNADIERQFETVQAQWCNDGDAFHLGDDHDYLAVGDGGSGKLTIPMRDCPPRYLHTPPDLVRTRGSEYLFVPGIRGLHLLASGRLDPAAR